MSDCTHEGIESALVSAVHDVLRNAKDTVWVGLGETLVDRMVSLGVFDDAVYEGAMPWEDEL